MFAFFEVEHFTLSEPFHNLTSSSKQSGGPGTLSVLLKSAEIEIEEDPFNLIARLSSNFTNQNFVTHTQRKTFTPVWNEEFHLYVCSLSLLLILHF